VNKVWFGILPSGEKMSCVKTCISLPKEQAEFVKREGYSVSRLIQKQITKLMENTNG